MPSNEGFIYCCSYKHKMIDKLFLAVIALAFTLPVEAGTPHDFNPGRDYGGSPPAARRASLDGECYDTRAGDRVCFRRVKDEIFQVAVIDVSESIYAHTMLINCDSNYHEGFGPLSERVAGEWTAAFCDNGRY